MTTTTSQNSGTGTGHAPHHAREGSHHSVRTHQSRMPAGGWLREVATSENWRTTTIVQRHRDRAAAPSSH
jgi:hypothetical protein